MNNLSQSVSGRNTHKLVIGFITYGKSTAKYLPYFLSSLNLQTYKNFKILAIDNTEERNNENRKIIKKNYPEIEFEWAGENIGFSRAYNKMIARAIDLGSEFFLMLNPDIVLEEDVIEKMIKTIEQDGELGSVCPKILRWDFKDNKKTNFIDSCGIKMVPGLRFIDVGQGQVDKGQFERVNILGPSGAAAMYRISALKSVQQDGFFFDELMFMYKEDCDLAYRLFLGGHKSKLVTNAIIYHDRTASSSGEGILSVVKDRKLKNKKIKAWSFLNQQIIFFKYWNLQSFYNKLKIIFYEIKTLVFILFFERFLLKDFFNFLWKARKKIKIYR